MTENTCSLIVVKVIIKLQVFEVRLSKSYSSNITKFVVHTIKTMGILFIKSNKIKLKEEFLFPTPSAMSYCDKER